MNVAREMSKIDPLSRVEEKKEEEEEGTRGREYPGVGNSLGEVES